MTSLVQGRWSPLLELLDIGLIDLIVSTSERVFVSVCWLLHNTSNYTCAGWFASPFVRLVGTIKAL